MTNIDELCHPAQHLIRDISSAYMKADVAFHVGDDAEELKRLLSATRAISTLLLFKFDDRVDDCTANEYAKSLFNGAERIKDIFERMGMKPVTCNRLDDTVPVGITMQCEATYTGMDAHKAIVCEHEPAAWCSLRGIWVCRRCCQMCYEDMYPEGCMEAEHIFRKR